MNSEQQLASDWCSLFALGVESCTISTSCHWSARFLKRSFSSTVYMYSYESNVYYNTRKQAEFGCAHLRFSFSFRLCMSSTVFAEQLVARGAIWSASIWRLGICGVEWASPCLLLSWP